MKQLTEQEREEFVLDCMRLITTEDLAKRYDVCRQTIRNRKRSKWFTHIHDTFMNDIAYMQDEKAKMREFISKNWLETQYKFAKLQEMYQDE